MVKFSNDGFLTVTGRVKDIFKTSKGKYIAPGVLEAPFLNLESVDQSCVMGSKYSQPFALVVLSEVGKRKDKSDVEMEIDEVLAFVNKDSMKHEQVKKVIVVKEEWTNANELLTPTLKMKRTALSEKYETALADFYNDNSHVSWE
jgi:long-subunit acyl-CoA synthetase (AMP-forming)